MSHNNYLFDGNYVLRRIAHAIGGAEPDFGPITQAGFLGKIRHVLFRFRPTRAYIVWDGGRSARRSSLLSEYKEHRNVSYDYRPCTSVITRCLRILGCRVMSLPGREADDVLHVLSRKLDGTSVIVSGDSDLFQLMSSGISVLCPFSDEFITSFTFSEKYFGIHPSQFLLYKALVGDKSDNIDGVYGIGPHYASKILNQFPWVNTPQELREELIKLKKSGKKVQEIVDSGDRIERNIELMDLSREIFFDNELRALEISMGREVSFNQKAERLLEQEELWEHLTAPDFPSWVVPFKQLA